MGTLIIWAVISAFVGLLSLAFSIGGGGDGGFFLTVAIILNAATVIRMFYEKKQFENKRFKTSQIVYIVSVAIAAVSRIILLLSGGLSGKNPALITLFIGYFVMVLVVMFSIGGTYLTCYLNSRHKPDESPLDKFFLPGGESREIKKHLRSAFIFIGVILIVVAIILFLIGGVESLDNGDLEYNDCGICGGGGKFQGKTCSYCGGLGGIAKPGAGTNDMTGIALWLAVFGAGSLVLVKFLKDEE